MACALALAPVSTVSTTVMIIERPSSRCLRMRLRRASYFVSETATEPPRGVLKLLPEKRLHPVPGRRESLVSCQAMRTRVGKLSNKKSGHNGTKAHEVGADGTELFSRTQAARALAIGERTLRIWHEQGRLVPAQKRRGVY